MKKKVFPLCAAADAAAAEEILEALRSKGFRLAGEGEKDAAVLLFLSSSFAADEAAQKAFFAADSDGRTLIPVDLDGAMQSELVRSALIAKNAIAAQGRTAEEIAERVASAEAFRKEKLPLARLLLAAAAALLVLGAGVWIWRTAPARAAKRERAAILSAAQLKYGLREEDLAGIRYVYIVSDGFYPLREDEGEKTYTIFPNHRMEADGVHWTSHEDGHRIYASAWDAKDWEVLKLMPNLEGLIIVLADAGSLPDLSGLEHLSWMQIIDSRITDIGGLSGSSLDYFGNFRCPVADYSPLTRCEKLTSVAMEFDFLQKADLSVFSPPGLEWASFGYAPAALELDLSGLKNCTELRELTLKDIPCGPPDGDRSPVTDLDFLADLPKLESLTLERMSFLRDVSAIGTLENLEYLKIEDCGALRDVSALGSLAKLHQLDLAQNERIADLSALGGCTELRALNMTGMPGVTDLSFLAELPNISSVGVLSTPLRDAEYLRAVAQRVNEDSGVSVCGQIRDVSALRYMTRFGSILICADGQNFDYFLPYLEGASGVRLSLFDFTDSALGALPELSGELRLENCLVLDLRGLREGKLEKISVVDDPALRSLDGVEVLENLGGGTLSIELAGCPLLYDLSALEGAHLEELTIRDMLSLPELPALRVDRLYLENITELSDLRGLDGLDASESVEITLAGLDGLRDLSALRRFHGDCLSVSPQLAEQAAELVESGNFARFEVAYPEDEWHYDADEEITLLRLDELQTLSPSLLRSVRRLTLAGDELVDPDRCEIREDRDENDRRVYALAERGADGETAIAPGTLTALPDLGALTGLRELRIYCQSLRDLEGVQSLGALEEAEVVGCASLEDASALFTLQSLRVLTLADCPVSSLQGVQNLTELEELDLRNTAVEDLRPLLELGALQRVRISGDMAAAAASLEGADLPFELIID